MQDHLYILGYKTVICPRNLCLFLNLLHVFDYLQNPQELSSLKLPYPLKIGHPKKKVVFQPPIFRGYVSLREGNEMKLSKSKREETRITSILASFWGWGWAPYQVVGLDVADVWAIYNDPEVTPNGGLVRESPPKWP